MKTFLLHISCAFCSLLLLTGCPGKRDNVQESNDDKVSVPASEFPKAELLQGIAQLDTFASFKDHKVYTQSGESAQDIATIVPNKREDLEDLRRVVKVYNGSKNAGLSVPGFGGITLGKDETNINIYYIEGKIIKSNLDTLVYGIGYSVHYLYKKVKSGVDVKNMTNIAASVQLENKKTSVYYSMQTYGISGLPVVRYFNPGDGAQVFDVSGFGTVQSSLNGIHNILADSLLSKHVKFTPRLLKNIRPYELDEIKD